MAEFTLAQCLSAEVVQDGSGFDAGTIISCEGTIHDLPRIKLSRHGKSDGPLAGCVLAFGAGAKGVYNIQIGADPAAITVGAGTRCVLDLRLWRAPVLSIGAGTTANGARIVIDDAEVRIGPDCLFSDEILLQSSDQHGLIDLATMQLTNAHRRLISVGEHVWVGRRATIMPDVEIGAGTVVAAGSIVTKGCGPAVYLAGAPARVVREGASWTRSPFGASELEEDFFRRIKPA